MLSILLAAQLAAPVPLTAALGFSPDDLPAYVQMAGRNRFVSTRTTVRTDGTVQDCIVERGSGDPKLDALTCSIIQRRAKFQPAKWLDGTPAYGVFRMHMNWVIGRPPSKNELEKVNPADIELSANLPAREGRSTEVKVVIAVNEDGRVVGCDEDPPLFDDHTKRVPELAPIACQQVMGGFTPAPAKDSSGRPVRSVQNATVLFTSGK